MYTLMRSSLLPEASMTFCSLPGSGAEGGERAATVDEGGAAGDGVGDVEGDFLGGAFVDEGAVCSAAFMNVSVVGKE